jgi:pimeloyl-ACP methyl ester carboxylesterase
MHALAAMATGTLLANAIWGRRQPKPPPAGRFADIAGRRIHYVERPGAGVPVVLLHGMPGTHLDFEQVVDELPGAHTIAVDRPGYGWSEGGPLDFQSQIDVIPALFDRLGIQRGVLVGHSFGGLLALGVAARFPEVVAGLALIAPSGGGLRSGPFRMAAAWLVRVTALPGVRQLNDLTVGGLTRRVGAVIDGRFAFAPDPVDPEYRRRLGAVTLHDDNLRAMAEDRLAYHRNIDWVDQRLPALKVPAVVVLAQGDHPIPIRHGRRLAAALRGSELIEVPGGHMLPIVQPGVVAGAIKTVSSGSALVKNN